MKKIFLLMPFFGMTLCGLLNCEKGINETFAQVLDNDADLHSSTIRETVDTKTPAITFLTHGLGGDASNWSNVYDSSTGKNGGYEANSYSLIERMRTALPTGINLYTIINNDNNGDTGNDNGYLVYSGYKESLLYEDYTNDEGKPDKKQTNKITDFSKHTVVVVDIETGNSMEKCYADFHYIVDRVCNDYFTIKNELPMINLVGHSMGGLFNMQYTIEHPKNVKSLISLGTPYNGSWYDNFLIENFAGIASFNNYPCICGTCSHEYYFCNLRKRTEEWNKCYA